MVESRPSSGTTGRGSWLSIDGIRTAARGSAAGIGDRDPDGVVDTGRGGGDGSVFEVEGMPTVEMTAISGSIRRMTRFATIRRAGRLTATVERTAMMPQVIRRM